MEVFMKAKKEQLKWNTLPEELMFYFLKRYIGIGAISILLIIFAITSGLYAEFLSILGCVMIYLGYVVYTYFLIIKNKISVLEGVCLTSVKESSQVINPISSFSIPFKRRYTTIYGKSYMIISVNEIKFEVPVSYRFEVKEGNTVRVYISQHNIYQKADNYYMITNPMLVKVVTM